MWHRVGGVDPNPVNKGGPNGASSTRSRRRERDPPTRPSPRRRCRRRRAPHLRADRRRAAHDEHADDPVRHARRRHDRGAKGHPEGASTLLRRRSRKNKRQKTSTGPRPSSPRWWATRTRPWTSRRPRPPLGAPPVLLPPRGKPRAARPASSRLNAPSDDPSGDVGFFGDGGAGGLRSSSRPVSGAVSDVDALTGMPYAMEGAKAPFARGAMGAEGDAPPALTLTPRGRPHRRVSGRRRVVPGWQHGGVSGQLSRRVARRANRHAIAPVRPHRQGPPDVLLQGRARARHRAAGTASGRQSLGRRKRGRAGGDAVRARVGSQIPRRVPVRARGGRRGDGHERSADDRRVGHRAGDARGFAPMTFGTAPTTTSTASSFRPSRRTTW